jgi:ribosomal protein S7
LVYTALSRKPWRRDAKWLIATLLRQIEKKKLEEELAKETVALADGFYKIFQKKTDKNLYATVDNGFTGD